MTKAKRSMAKILRYTALRLLVFFGILSALFLCGMKGFLLLIVAALLSTLVSYFLLARFREETVTVVQSRVEEKQERAQRMREAEDFDDE